MAIDSERKRKSAAQMSVSHGPVTIVPDGSLGAADRQTVGWGYPFSEPAAPETLSAFMMFIDP